MYSRRAGAILGCANSKKTRLLLKVVTRSDVISGKFDFAPFYRKIKASDNFGVETVEQAVLKRAIQHIVLMF